MTFIQAGVKHTLEQARNKETTYGGFDKNCMCWGKLSEKD